MKITLNAERMAVELSALKTTYFFCDRDSNPDLPLVRQTLEIPIEQPLWVIIQLFKKNIVHVSVMAKKNYYEKQASML